MKKTDIDQFCEIMGALAENFQTKLSQPRLNLMFSALQEFDVEQIQSAARHILKTHKFANFPPLALFIEHMAPEKSADDLAEIQAHKVISQISSVGSYGTPKFDDPITTQLIGTRFKWRDLCETLTKARLNWFVKEFKDGYLAYSNNPEQLTIGHERATELLTHIQKQLPQAKVIGGENGI